MDEQLDMFGDRPQSAPKRAKKQVDKRLVAFKRVYGAYTTPYIISMTFSEGEKPDTGDDYALIDWNKAQQIIKGTCTHFGMTRTVLDEGLVAIGNGRFLYMLAYGGDSASQGD